MYRTTNLASLGFLKTYMLLTAQVLCFGWGCAQDGDRSGHAAYALFLSLVTF